MTDPSSDGAPLIVFASIRYALAFSIVAAGLLIGRALARRVPFASRSEEASLCASLGLGAIGLILFALGVARCLTTTASLAAIGLAVAVSWAARPRRGVGAPVGDASPRPASRAFVGLALVLLVAPAFLLPLYPPIAWDATGYHLPHAKLYASTGRLAINPFLRYPVFPLLNEMLFSLALFLRDDVVAQLVQFATFLLLVLVLFAFGRRVFSERVGIWGAALFAGSSQVLWLGSIAYVDMGVTLFTTAAVFAFWRWRSERRTPWLVLSAALCGLAAGTKYLGLVMAGLLGLVAALDALRSRTLRPVILFAAVFAAVASPWYVRNAVTAGNPVFPFLPRLFGTSFWNHEDLAWLESDVIRNHGVGRSAASLLTLPWSLVFRQSAFDAEARISPLFGLAIPILIIAGWKSRAIGLLSAIGLAYVVFWFSSAQILRYLLPALPLLSLAIAATADRIVGLARAARRWTDSRAFASAVAVLLVLPGWSYSLATVKERGWPPTSAAGRRAFLVENRRSYPAYEFLNATRGRNYAVYAYREQCMTYFADGAFVGDYFGPGRYSRVEACWDDGEALYRSLKEVGATHLLVSSWYGKIRVPANEGFNRRFRVVFARANTTLFEIADAPVRRVLGANRLANPGFEALANGWPEGWQSTGRPVVETRGDPRAGARGEARGESGSAGPVVVRLTGERECVFEDVAVTPGEQCVFRSRVQSDGRGGAVTLSVLWFDSAGRPVGTDSEVSPVGIEWQTIRMLVTVPEAAAVARAAVSPYRQSSVRLDDVLLSDVSYAPGTANP